LTTISLNTNVLKALNLTGSVSNHQHWVTFFISFLAIYNLAWGIGHGAWGMRALAEVTSCG